MNEDLFVFSSVGSMPYVEYLECFDYQVSVFNSWEIKNYDSGCVVYNKASNFPYEQYFKKILKNEGYKFPNFFLYDKKYSITDKYKYIAILDDDLLFNQENTFKKVLQIMKENKLNLCSLCNDQKGRFSTGQNSEKIMGPKDSNELWITNFVEMGCMILTSDLINFVKKEYNDHTIVDFGFDYLICNVANKLNLKMGVIKNQTFYNPHKKQDRDIGYNEWNFCKERIPVINSNVKEVIYF